MHNKRTEFALSTLSRSMQCHQWSACRMLGPAKHVAARWHKLQCTAEPCPAWPKLVKSSVQALKLPGSPQVSGVRGRCAFMTSGPRPCARGPVVVRAPVPSISGKRVVQVPHVAVPEEADVPAARRGSL